MTTTMATMLMNLMNTYIPPAATRSKTKTLTGWI